MHSLIATTRSFWVAKIMRLPTSRPIRAIPHQRSANVDRWYKPDHIEGYFVGMNITFDGRLVMSTDHGWVVVLARDFSEYHAIQVAGGAEQAAEYCAMRAAERGHTGYGWMRTSICVDDDNGIYVSSTITTTSFAGPANGYRTMRLTAAGRCPIATVGAAGLALPRR